ncbi:hypothetical protein CK203_056657 [Vitis vinifera]|uniref:Uncharacterized protein n=1 Tax=Vitis vinifera TaxID=29760 RepID=A0A438GNN8_VITVI|nr:hypothetical protein CK203_056657 [Vitis vinifera]
MAAAEAKERAKKAAAEARERANTEAREKKAQARERAVAEARERAAARVNQQKNENDLESFFSMSSRPSSVPRPRANSSDPMFGIQFQNRCGPEMARTSTSASSTMRKASSTTNIVDDFSSILETYNWLNYFLLQKLLHHLENSKKLKGKVKTDGELGWKVTKGLRSVRQKHWLRKISGISKLRGNKQREMSSHTPSKALICFVDW